MGLLPQASNLLNKKESDAGTAELSEQEEVQELDEETQELVENQSSECENESESEHETASYTTTALEFVPDFAIEFRYSLYLNYLKVLQFDLIDTYSVTIIVVFWALIQFTGTKDSLKESREGLQLDPLTTEVLKKSGLNNLLTNNLLSLSPGWECDINYWVIILKKTLNESQTSVLSILILKRTLY